VKNIIEIVNDIIFILFRLFCIPILFIAFYSLGLVNLVIGKCVEGIATLTEYFIQDDED
jgi:hypothetical protein